MSGVFNSVIGAGENHLGEVAGSGKSIKVAQTVSTSPAYSSGDAIGENYVSQRRARERRH